MRKFMFSLALLLFFASVAFAQKLSPSVINASGGSKKVPSENFYLDWSVAEMTVVNTMQGTVPGPPSKVVVLTNGFLQSEKAHDNVHKDVVKVIETANVLTANDIKVYPNPAVSYIEVQFYTGLSGKTHLTLFNASGVVVYSRVIQLYGKGNIERIPVQTLLAGSYLLQVYNESDGGSRKGTFKIIKVN